jgi:uncharacterized protein with von Willebrand factor type A (vWA) domain
MQHAMEGFLRALRANEVRVSPAEAIDAHRAAAAVGFEDRTAFRDALCVTLAKSADEVARFEACFDAFYARPPDRRPPPADAGDRAVAPPDAPELAQQMLDGDDTALDQAIEASAARVGSGEIRLASQRSLMTRRLLDDMGLREVEALIQRLRGAGARRRPAWPSAWPSAGGPCSSGPEPTWSARCSSMPPRAAGGCARASSPANG